MKIATSILLLIIFCSCNNREQKVIPKCEFNPDTTWTNIIVDTIIIDTTIYNFIAKNKSKYYRIKLKGTEANKINKITISR